MSADRQALSPAASPAASESGHSYHSRTTKRGSGTGLVYANTLPAELRDFEDIDLGNHDPGDGDSAPRLTRARSDTGGVGMKRSRSPYETSDGPKSYRRSSSKQGSISSGFGKGSESPSRSSGGDTSRPSSKRGLTVPSSLETIPNGIATNMGRKGSRHRRTSCETDRNYDSDDSVPPGTVLTNIPVSPSKIPQSHGLEKFNNSFNGDRQRPRTVSGEGPVSDCSPKSLRSDASPERLSPRAYPRRVVSYHEAMSALDDDSKRLTHELEKITIGSDGKEVHSDDKGPDSNLNPLPLLARQSQRATGHAQLLTSRLLDPLPMSKEKEAVLSQTRPSWLPPKNKAEEKRHLAEYQKMVEQAKQAEIKRQEKALREKEERDEIYSDTSRAWAWVISNWEAAIGAPRVRTLFWNGIPSARRGLVWQKSFGNALRITEDTYKKAVARVSDAERAISESSPDDETEAIATVFRRIELDCASIFQELKIFQPGAPLYDDLVQVTKAYTLYRSNSMHIPGAHAVAATFLINLNPFQSFSNVANALNRSLPHAFLSGDSMAKHKYYTQFDNLFYLNLEVLHGYFGNTLRLHPSVYLDKFLGCLFAMQMQLEILSRIWDIYAFEGDDVLLRIAVVVLWHLEPKLYVEKEEVLRTLTKERWDLGKEDVFIKKIWMIRVN